MSMRRTRRYRPKRTYRRTYRRVGEGSMICGSSYGQAFKLSQEFEAINPDGSGSTLWDQDGQIITAPGQYIRSTNLRAAPDEIIGLRERQKFYKHWKITGVKYHFYKDSMGANNGAVAYTNYIDKYDNLQSKVIYNPLDEATPNASSAAHDQALADWITQQKGQLLPTINGRKKNIYCKAMMNKKVVFTNGDGENEEKQLVRFPWLNSDLNATSQSSDIYTTGLCTAFIPRIQIATLLNNPTYSLLGDSTAPGGDARRRLSQRFQWYCRIQLFWCLKGKYYNAELGRPFIKSEDIVEHPIAPTQAEIEAAIDDLKMSDDEN